MKPRAFYNDNDSRVCAWVRELMADGLIMEGDVDERSIKEIQPEELAGYTRIHLFCGIAGWDHALQLADWPADRPVLTCSAPCQSFSCAGQGAGVNDPRHLWPEAFRIIRALKPECVIGEQVAAAIGHGWLDGVRTDLEGEGYSCGHIVLGAHSAGAPHIRQRIYWCGLANSTSPRCIRPLGDAEGQARDETRVLVSGERGEDGGLADSNGGESGERELQRGGGLVQQPQDEAVGGLEHTAGDGREQWGTTSGERGVERGCGAGGLGDAECAESARLRSHGGQVVPKHQEPDRRDHPNPWARYDLVPCADGKARRIESGLQPLAHGVPGRVGLLRGAGNAIVPQVAAQFIKAVMDLKGGENHAQEAKKEKVRRLLKKDLRSSA